MNKIFTILILLFSYYNSCSQSAKDYFLKGVKKFEAGDDKGAILYFNNALKINPDYAGAYYYRAKTKAYLNDYSGAIKDFNKAISIEPRLIYAYIHIAKGNTLLKNYEKAIENYIKYIEKIDSISSINEEFMVEDSVSIEACYQKIGNLYFKMNNFENAKSYFTKAIEIDSLDSYAFYARGFNNYFLNDFQSALSDLNHSIIIDSKYSDALVARAKVKARLNDYEGAINDYLQFQILEPENKTAYFEIGLCYKFQKKYFEAIKYFNLAIEFNNSPISECYYERGNAKSNLEDYRGAVIDFTKALESNPNLNDCYYFRGQAKLFLDDNRGAIIDFTKYITKSPNGERLKFAYAQRGLAKISLNQKESGCLDLSKSGELGYEGAYESIKELCK